MARKIKHEFRVGDKIAAPDGFNADGSSRPWKVGVIEELYGPNDWPRVNFGNGVLETVTPNAIRKSVTA